MITKEQAKQLIMKNSSERSKLFDDRLITPSEIETLFLAIMGEIHKAEEEWEELVQLKAENAILKAENEVYKSFLTSANYKIPQSHKMTQREE